MIHQDIRDALELARSTNIWDRREGWEQVTDHATEWLAELLAELDGLHAYCGHLERENERLRTEREQAYVTIRALVGETQNAPGRSPEGD